MNESKKYSDKSERSVLEELSAAQGREINSQAPENLGIEELERAVESLSVEELEREAEMGDVRISQELRSALNDLVDGLDAVEKISAPDFSIAEPDASSSSEGRASSDADRMKGTAIQPPARRGSLRLWIAGIAAAVALVVVLGSEGYRYRTPKDTFDDPIQALAFMQETMDSVGEKIGKGLKRIDDTREAAMSNIWIFKSEQNKD